MNRPITTYIDSMSEMFCPATSTDTATHLLSTDEIFAAILELNPGAEIKKEDLFDALLDAGYIFKPRPNASGLDFRWMLVTK